MKYNFIEIGNRIANERIAHGWSQDKLIEKLSYKDIRIGRNTLSNIENGSQKPCNFSLGLLAALAELFECEIGYLLCEKEYNCRTRCDTDIYKETGLNEKSIQTLRTIQKSDENENMITVFPKNLYNKMINKEEMTQDEMKEFERIFFNPSKENLKSHPSNRPKLMDLLNFMFSCSFDMENLLMAFRNLINPFTVPVFYDDEKGWTFPNNQWSKDVSFNGHITYTINLASDEKKPGDNFPIWIDKNFLDSIYIKSIENIFHNFRDGYYNQNKSA